MGFSSNSSTILGMNLKKNSLKPHGQLIHWIGIRSFSFRVCYDMQIQMLYPELIDI